MKRYITFLGFCIAASGCTTVDFVDLRAEVAVTPGFLITTGDGKSLHRPIGLMQVRHMGLMLFGIFPVSPGYIADVTEEFRRVAVKYGANAAINVEFETWRPPFPLCLFWWVSSSTIKGEAVYIPDLK